MSPPTPHSFLITSIPIWDCGWSRPGQPIRLEGHFLTFRLARGAMREGIAVASHTGSCVPTCGISMASNQCRRPHPVPDLPRWAGFRKLAELGRGGLGGPLRHGNLRRVDSVDEQAGVQPA